MVYFSRREQHVKSEAKGHPSRKLFIVIQIQSTITMYCLEKIDPFNIKQLSRYKNIRLKTMWWLDYIFK